MNTRASVFVVDDDAAIRKSLSLTLRQRGYAVESFDSAEAFFAAGRAEEPGCLILDVRMPGTSGLEQHEQLRKAGIAMPVILITAHASVPMAVNATRKGAFEFLEKPYELPMLVARIDDALRQDEKRRRDEVEQREACLRYASLSGRESEILTILVAGAADTSNRTIADRVGISPRTVETYRGRLMVKMGAHSLVDLARIARLAGVNES